MAVWSEISFSALYDDLNIAAENYHPEKLKWLSRLANFGGEKIASIAKPIRQIVTPNSAVPVFDLSAARKHVLQEGDCQIEERVSSKKVARSGDIIISRLRSYLQQVAVVPDGLDKIHVSTEFIVLRSTSGKDIKFLVPYFLSLPVQTILEWSQGGNEHPRFNEEVLLRLPIIPAVKRITDKLTHLVDQAAVSLSMSKVKYASAKRLLLSELGLDDLDLSPTLFYERNFSEFQAAARLDAEFFQPMYQSIMKNLESTNPKRITRLEEFLSLLTNGHTPLYHDLSEGEVPFLTAEHVFDFRINYDSEKRILQEHHEGELKRTRLKKGDCLITIKGRIGNAAIAEDFTGPVNINQDVALFRLNDGLPPYYLMAYLNSEVGQAFTRQYCTGQINPFLGLGNIRQLPVPIYETQKMNTIAEKTKETVLKARAARDESRRLLEEAKRMVEEAIMGERGNS